MATEKTDARTARSNESFLARRSAISAILLLLLILLILLLIAAATERTDILKFAGLALTQAV
jgi:preprotein translocase subunit SecG